MWIPFVRMWSLWEEKWWWMLHIILVITANKYVNENRHEEKNKPNASSFSKLITHRAILLFHLKIWLQSVCTTCQNVVGKKTFFSRIEFVWKIFIDGTPTGWSFLTKLQTYYHFSWNSWTDTMNGCMIYGAIKTVRHKSTPIFQLQFQLISVCNSIPFNISNDNLVRAAFNICMHFISVAVQISYDGALPRFHLFIIIIFLNHKYRYYLWASVSVSVR